MEGHRARRTVDLAVAVPVLLVVLAGSIMAAVMIGPVPIPAATVVQAIASHLGLAVEVSEPTLDGIVWNLRLPRVLMAAVCGAGLAGVGTVMQGVTRNPLADPYLLGLSSGASLGAVIVVALGIATIGSAVLAGAAFAGAVIAFVLVLAVASTAGRLPPVRTVLAGVAIGELCAAATSFIVISSTDAQTTRSILKWLLGSLAGTEWTALWLTSAVLAAFVVGTQWDARAIDALALGDDTAESLGFGAHRARRRLLVWSAALTGVLVAANGAIGFVGLVIPHVVRPFTGARHARLLPVSMLVGASFLVWVDTVARTAFEPQELPVGVLTALIGAPFFAVQIRRQGRFES